MANDGTAAVAVGPLKASLDATASQLLTGTGVNASGLVGEAKAQVEGIFAGTAGNAAPTRLPLWRRGLARVRAGSGSARILDVGDSTTSALRNVGRANATSGFLARILAGQGIPTRHASFFGSSGQTASDYGFYNPEIGPLPSGWTFNTASLGGGVFFNNSTTTPLVWSPVQHVDTFEIYYGRNSGNATFNASIDGGAPVVTDSAGSPLASQKLTVTAGSVGAHTLSLARTGVGSGLIILGTIAYDSTKPAVDVINAGWSGSLSSQWADSSSALRAFNVIPLIGADLIRINLGINDYLQAVSVETFRSNMLALLNQCKASADVILTVPVPTAANTGAAIPVAVQEQYREVIRDLAAQADVPVLDTANRWASYEYSNPLGFYVGDDRHPSAIGYADIAQGWTDLLT